MASGWSLSQLLAHLGSEVADITFNPLNGEEAWRYDHSSMKLHGDHGAVDLRLLFELNGHTHSAAWSPQWNDSGSKGVLTLGQLSPLRRGTWTGDALRLQDPAGRLWSANPGVLLEPGGAVRYRVSGIAPPALLTWLVEQE